MWSRQQGASEAAGSTIPPPPPGQNPAQNPTPGRYNMVCTPEQQSPGRSQFPRHSPFLGSKSLEFHGEGLAMGALSRLSSREVNSAEYSLEMLASCTATMGGHGAGLRGTQRTIAEEPEPWTLLPISSAGFDTSTLDLGEGSSQVMDQSSTPFRRRSGSFTRQISGAWDQGPICAPGGGAGNPLKGFESAGGTSPTMPAARHPVSSSSWPRIGPHTRLGSSSLGSLPLQALSDSPPQSFAAFPTSQLPRHFVGEEGGSDAKSRQGSVPESYHRPKPYGEGIVLEPGQGAAATSRAVGLSLTGTPSTQLPKTASDEGTLGAVSCHILP